MSIKFFPFSPGIPWITSGMVVQKKVPESFLYKILENKEIITLCNSSLIETYCSLLYLETFNKKIPKNKLLWSGDSRFYPLIKANGLSSGFVNLKITTSKNYPTPIFLDKTNKAIFNCLFNYKKIYTYTGKKKKVDNSALIKQIYNGCLFPWNKSYIPIFRDTQFLDELIDWQRAFNFSFKSKYVVIIPEGTGFSNRKKDCLGWDVSHIKSLSSMLKSKGISTVVFTKNPELYTSTGVLTPPFKLMNILHFISKAHSLLSKEVDYLLIGLISSSAKILSNYQFSELRLSKNNDFLGGKNELYINYNNHLNTMKPSIVFEEIMSKGLSLYDENTDDVYPLK